MKFLTFLLTSVFLINAHADGFETKLKPLIESAKNLAAKSAIVDAVKSANDSPSAASKSMTQESWKELKIIDSVIKEFTKNPAADELKNYKDEKVAEAFISAANGNKVAFLAKTSSWSHKGKPKHDVPMSNKVWIGKVETDDSTGMQQIQFAVPVLDKGKAIGSLVVGVLVSKL